MEKWRLIWKVHLLRMKENKDFTHLKATEDFGYTPMSFEEGIKEEIKEYKRNMK